MQKFSDANRHFVRFARVACVLASYYSVEPTDPCDKGVEPRVKAQAGFNVSTLFQRVWDSVELTCRDLRHTAHLEQNNERARSLRPRYSRRAEPA